MRGQPYLIHDQKWHALLNRVWLFDYIPFLDFVLVAGSMATGNVHARSDWDVIVGTRDGRLYTARFFCLLLFGLFGLRRIVNRPDQSNGFCFNHFIAYSTPLDTPHDEYSEEVYKRLTPIFGRRDLITLFLSRSGQEVTDERFQDLRYLYRNETPTTPRAFFEYIFRGRFGGLIEYLVKDLQHLLIKKNLIRFGANQSSRIIVRDDRVELCFVPKLLTCAVAHVDSDDEYAKIVSIMANINPIHDRVFLEAIEEDRITKSGIVLPDTAEKERPVKGRVVAAGPGKRNDRGEFVPLSVKVGDVVLFKKYGPDEVEIEGKKYLVAEENDILAILAD